MNRYLEYLLEANLALGVFLLAYTFFLSKEKNFHGKRLVLLSGIIASLLFPLIHIENSEVNLPSVNAVMTLVYLPEFTMNAGATATEGNPWNSIVFAAMLIYTGGVIVLLLAFLLQLVRISRILYGTHPVALGKLYIGETTRNISSFSFFNYILIGQADALSEKEKRQIIDHERIHAEQFHSFDILLINIIAIFFWFNPVVWIYKNIFIQLHEFEADARAVRTHEVNDYCSLLARVALLSADIRIANYFSNSLTLKRIQMIRTIKPKLKRWKMVATVFALPLLFVVIACNDQVIQEVNSIAETSTMAIEAPAHVTARLDELKKLHPEKNYILVQLSGEGTEKLTSIEKEYGLPTSMEVFKPEASNNMNSTGKDDESFVILEYNQVKENVSSMQKEEGEVFTIVEETATFPGGLGAFYQYLGSNLSYPKEAREKKIEGKVMIEYIVETDGTITNVTVKKGVEPSLDAEAVRVMKSSPNWIPGKQQGKAVRQKVVLPIQFNLGANDKKLRTSMLNYILLPYNIAPRPNGNEGC